MKKTTCWLAAAIPLLASGLAAAQETRYETVRFPGDSTMAEIPGRIQGYESVVYELYAGDGQLLEVSLRAGNPAANFNIYLPGRGPGDEALHASEMSGTEYVGTLFETGPHSIAVFLNRAAARRGEEASYDLVVSLTRPEQAAASADAPSRAESDCLAAVANEVGNGDVSVIRSEMGETSTEVLVQVPGAQAPWVCRWGYRDGSPQVLQVYYGAEG